MTSEPPPRPARRTRPDPAFRRRALGLDAPAPGDAPPAVVRRESLRNALSRIPDLERTEDGAPAVVPVVPAAVPPSDPTPPAAPKEPVEPVEVPAAVPASEPATSAASATSTESATRAPLEPVAAATTIAAAPPRVPKAQRRAAVPAVPPMPEPAGTHHARRIAPPPHPPWWRRLAFAASIVVLVAAIPVLGRTGYRLVTASTDGRAGASGAGPNDPGYEELVTSTPTALVIQKDSGGLPVALTFLSLSSGAAGGSVIFVPLDTNVVEPGYGVDRLRTSYTAVASDPTGATTQIAFQTAKVLNVGIDEIVQLDDRGWSQLVAPVAPIPLDNPEPLDLSTGSIDSGNTTLSADQFGPYLAAIRDGEAPESGLFRQEVAWTAWLKAVAASTKADAVPGESATGIGLFARTLAKGPVSFNDLPGTFSTETDGSGRFTPDASAVNDLVVDAVPAPDAPAPGSRVTVRLLNGVGPGDIPGDVIRKVVSLNGAVTVIGNGPSFDRDTTTIVYSDPAKKDYALLLKGTLGAGTVRLDRTAADYVDVTVVLGRDLLGDGPQTRSNTSVTSPDSTTSTTAGDGSSSGGGETTTTSPDGQPQGGL